MFSADALGLFPRTTDDILLKYGYNMQNDDLLQVSNYRKTSGAPFTNIIIFIACIWNCTCSWMIYE